MVDKSDESPLSHVDATRAGAVRDAVFAPIRGSGLVQQTVRRIADAVQLGLLGEGERLPPETDLATRLEISAMTLREALAILRESGWITTKRGKGGGTVVMRRPEPSPSVLEVLNHDYLYELTAMRRAISGEASALAAERATPDAISRLEFLVAQTVPAKSNWEYRQADAALHIGIAVASRCQRLSNAEANLQIELNDLLPAGLHLFVKRTAKDILHASTREHADLIQAIKDRDPVRAREITVEHVTGTYNFILAVAPQLGQPSTSFL